MRATTRPKLSCGCRKLHDFVRQFGLRYQGDDHLTEYLVNQVRNRHAHSIRRLSEAAHPFLVERIKRESIQAEFHDVRRGFHVFGPFITPFPNVPAKVLENFRASGGNYRGRGVQHLNRED